MLAGWALVILGLAHIGLTFQSFERLSLDGLWFAGSGALVLLIGALNVVLGGLPERFQAQARGGRAVVLGANLAGAVFAVAFMWIQGGLTLPGPVLVLMFAIAAAAQLARGSDRTSGPQLFGTGPVIPVADVHAAVAFYHDVLGFDIDFEMDTPPTHASVTRCGVGFQFTLAQPEVIREPYAGWTYVFVTGIDALHAEYSQRGVVITQSLGSRSHGMREFEIADLNGHRLRFGQYLT